MPTVLRDGRFRLFFYSNEGDPREPVHVHVEVGNDEAKFWLDPVRPAWNRGLSARDMARAAELVQNNADRIAEAWGGFFG